MHFKIPCRSTGRTSLLVLRCTVVLIGPVIVIHSHDFGTDRTRMLVLARSRRCPGSETVVRVYRPSARRAAVLVLRFAVVHPVSVTVAPRLARSASARPLVLARTDRRPAAPGMAARRCPAAYGALMRMDSVVIIPLSEAVVSLDLVSASVRSAGLIVFRTVVAP